MPTFGLALGGNLPVAFLETSPGIGPVTKFPLAKNFGANFAKPDVHLNRLAGAQGCSAQELCERLSQESGYRAATADLIFWCAHANGIISSRSYKTLPGDGPSA